MIPIEIYAQSKTDTKSVFLNLVETRAVYRIINSDTTFTYSTDFTNMVPSNFDEVQNSYKILPPYNSFITEPTHFSINFTNTNFTFTSTDFFLINNSKFDVKCDFYLDGKYISSIIVRIHIQTFF